VGTLAVPIIDPTQTITITRGDGLVIAKGSASMLADQVKDGRQGRADAAKVMVERVIIDHKERELDARADALAERERTIQAREDAAYADGMARLTRGLSDIARRMDAFEKRRDEERLAKEIADADRALAALQSDDGDLEAIKEAPHELDKEVIRAHEAEDAIRTGADDFDGGSPALPANEPEPIEPSQPLGALTDSIDMATYNRTFTCARDRKAFKRAMRK
jgi:hypothetical protein